MSFERACAGKSVGARRNYLLSDSEKSSTLCMTECPLLEDFSSPPARSPPSVRSNDNVLLVIIIYQKMCTHSSPWGGNKRSFAKTSICLTKKAGSHYSYRLIFNQFMNQFIYPFCTWLVPICGSSWCHPKFPIL
jgi:hypothetical protein